MREIKKHIFLETISYENRHMSPRNLYIIRGEERSLMVDTSNNTERDWTILKGMIDALGIDCRKLDIFITHEHPDHTGLVPKLQELGARAFMNPDETRKRVDLLHSYLADERARIENLRIVGVTKEETPEVYDTFMDNIPYEEWCEYLTGLMREYGVRDGLVLDLGCGTGNMTELLAKAGYDMIGADNAEEMLEIAMEKRDKSGHDILYLLQDMQDFELYGTVRAVISVCDSMNYLTDEEDLEYLFALVNNYLDPGGLFIFDMNTVHKYRDVIGDTTIAEDREDGSFIWENSYDRENALNVYELALFLPREDGLYEKCEEEHVQKAYSIEAIKAMIVKAGMELVAVCDAYTHNPGDENCERLTFVAREHGKSAQNGYHGRIPEKPETHRAD